VKIVSIDLFEKVFFIKIHIYNLSINIFVEKISQNCVLQTVSL
jgi:hypothetical protein